MKIFNYIPEYLLSGVFLLSLNPYILNNHGSGFYQLLGAILSASSYFSFNIYKQNRKATMYYCVLLSIIIILFIISMFIVGGKYSTDSYSNFELFLCPYFGSVFGIMFAGVVDSKIIERNKK